MRVLLRRAPAVAAVLLTSTGEFLGAALADSDGASSASVFITNLPDTPEQLLAVNQGARP